MSRGCRRCSGRRSARASGAPVTQEDIDTFAELSGDDQWIHVDVERAKTESPFGTTIAHGNLTLSLVDGFRKELISSTGFALGVNYGWNKIRFPAPVPVDARVRGQGRGRLGRREGRRLVGGRHPLHPRGRGQREALLRRRLRDAGDGAGGLTLRAVSISSSRGLFKRCIARR